MRFMVSHSSLPIFCLLLGAVNSYLGISLIAMSPNAHALLMELNIAHFLGVAFMGMTLPLLLAPWTRYEKSDGIVAFLRAFGPLFLVMFSCIAFRLPGFAIAMDNRWISCAYQFCAGMQIPLVYCLFFTQVSPERRAFPIGLAIALGLLAWRLTLQPPLADGAPETIFARLESIFFIQLVFRIALFVILVTGFIASRRNLLPPPDSLKVGVLHEEERRNSIRRLLAACILSSIAYCILDAKLSLTINESYGIDLGHRGILIIIFCPVLGYCIDRWRAKAFRCIVLVYFIFLLLAPSLAPPEDPYVDDAIHLLSVIGQFAVFIVMPVALSRLVRFDRWFCMLYSVIYILRCASIMGVLLVRPTGLIHSDLITVAATLAAIAFYFLVKGVRFPEEIGADATGDEERDTPVQAAERVDAPNVTQEDEEPSHEQHVLPYHVRQNLYELYAKYGLSRREREVATLILEGNGTRDIAQGLDISEHTVKAHVRNILTKFQVSSRQALLAKFLTESMDDRHPQT